MADPVCPPSKLVCPPPEPFDIQVERSNNGTLLEQFEIEKPSTVCRTLRAYFKDGRIIVVFSNYLTEPEREKADGVLEEAKKNAQECVLSIVHTCTRIEL